MRIPRLASIALRIALCLGAWMAFGFSPANAQTPTPGAAASQMSAAASDQAPVAVPEPTEKALSYYRTRIALWAIDLVWSLVVPALILFTGASARIRDLAAGVSSKGAVRFLVYFLVYSLIAFTLGLPLAFYEDFVVEHRFGLSNQEFSKWIGDSLIMLGVSTLVGYGVLLGTYRLLRRRPADWWLVAGVFAIPLVFLFTMVEPIWIDPLFNKFGPMKDRALEAKILALADRAGIEGSRVFEVDKSVDTKTTNAYVNGFMDTKRIVLWDTIIAKLDEPELMFVMGHEMGHYVLGHAWKGNLFLCGLIVLSLYGVHRLSRGLIRRHSRRFGFERLDDIASLPLILLVGGAAFGVALPAFNAYSRHAEHEADRFGLEITRNNHAAASAFVKLQRDNLGNPRPNELLHILRGTHPTLAQRIEFANDYKPWARGAPLRYGEHIKP
jgi:STE24 endopeptidase